MDGGKVLQRNTGNRISHSLLPLSSARHAWTICDVAVAPMRMGWRSCQPPEPIRVLVGIAKHASDGLTGEPFPLAVCSNMRRLRDLHLKNCYRSVAKIGHSRPILQI